MIRLATAHAKARLSNFVQDQDANAAIDILKFALFKEAPKKKSRSKRARLDRSMGESDSDNSSDDDDESNNRNNSQRMIAPSSQRRASARGSTATQFSASKGKTPLRGSMAEDVEMMDVDGDHDEIEEELTATRRALNRGSKTQSNIPSQGSSTSTGTSRYIPGGDIHPSRKELFQVKTNRRIMSADEESIEFEELLVAVNKDLDVDELFGPAEATAILTQMNEENKLMFSEGVIYKI